MYIMKALLTEKAEGFLRKIYDYNLRTHRPVRTKDISDEYCQSAYITMLIKEGLIERVKYGHYAVTEAGENYIENVPDSSVEVPVTVISSDNPLSEESHA